MPLPELPSVLTYAHWNSKKKTGTPTTGIGKQLKEIEKLYGALPADSVETLAKFKNPAELVKAKAEVESARNGAIKKFRTYVIKFGNDATKKAVEAKKAKLFPKTSRELIEEMALRAGYLPKAIEDHIGVELGKADKRLAEGRKTVQATLDGAIDAINEGIANLGKVDGLLTKAEAAITKFDKDLRTNKSLTDADRKTARSKLLEAKTKCGGLAEAAVKVGVNLRGDKRVVAVRGGGAARICSDNGVDYANFKSSFSANMKKFDEFEDQLQEIGSRADEATAAVDTAILLTTEGLDDSKRAAMALTAIEKTLQKGKDQVLAAIGKKLIDQRAIDDVGRKDFSALGPSAKSTLQTQVDRYTLRREKLNKAMIALVGLMRRELEKVPATYRAGDGKKLTDQITADLKDFNKTVQEQKVLMGKAIDAYAEAANKVGQAGG